MTLNKNSVKVRFVNSNYNYVKNNSSIQLSNKEYNYFVSPDTRSKLSIGSMVEIKTPIYNEPQLAVITDNVTIRNSKEKHKSIPNENVTNNNLGYYFLSNYDNRFFANKVYDNYSDFQTATKQLEK